MTPVVVDASAGVELALKTPIGLQLDAKIPGASTIWVPEHYYAEAVAVLRRHELNGRVEAPRVQLALDRHNLTFADALYVVVAQRLGAELVTADMRLSNAPGLPVSTITP
ncbi:MAG: putative nucleic acid-binding protein contains domain [Acidimicrobiales bacterium]|nr:putative nucleic acid-binding protein contains domain [Acidimicrobiales bacterium]